MSLVVVSLLLTRNPNSNGFNITGNLFSRYHGIGPLGLTSGKA